MIDEFSLVFLDAIATGSESMLSNDFSTYIASILVAAFGIAVGFVAYKLIKRALNKA